jgi:glycosyltransferase involved in cell wall biosynthesis
MANGPMVSIILPTFNGARYLETSIRSCLNQIHQNLEVIVVDDTSTDGAREIISRLSAADSRVKLITVKDQGLPRSLNVGLAQSSGDYLTWFSDDDLYEPQAMASMVRVLEERPDVGLVHADSVQIGPNDEVLSAHPSGSPEMLVHFCSLSSCILYRRKVYEVVGGYDPEMVLVEDWDHLIRIYKNFPMAHVPEMLYRKRIHPGSLSTKRFLDCRRQTARLLCRHVEPESPYSRVLAKVFVRTGWQFFGRGERSNALLYGFRSVCRDPLRSDGWKLMACAVLKKPVVSSAN